MKFQIVMKKDPRVTAYIEKAPAFAKPILNHLRKVIHAAKCPLEENIKWGMPSFEYKGIVCGFAAFKAHCAFGFYKQALLHDPKKILLATQDKTAMGNLGKITSKQELPADKDLIALIQQAVALNEENVKPIANRKKEAKPFPTLHPEFQMALKKSKKAETVFKNFAPSHQREYIEWINDAKTEPTRDRRIQQAIEWISEGKGRNWKYEKC